MLKWLVLLVFVVGIAGCNSGSSAASLAPAQPPADDIKPGDKAKPPRQG